jgi:protein KRI1
VTIENEDSDDDLLVPRGKTKDEADLEEEEYREFLEREVGQDLKELITLDEPSGARRPTMEDGDGDGDEAVANGEETKKERKARKKEKKRREKEKEQKGKEAASQGSQKQNKEDQDREFLMKSVSLCLGHD